MSRFQLRRGGLTVLVVLTLSVAGCGGGKPAQPSATSQAGSNPAGAQSAGTPSSAAQGGARTAGEPYLFGFNSDMIGPFADLSKAHLAGLKAYIHRLNKNGGIDGHPVQLEVMDTRFDVATGIANTKALAEKKVLAIWGNVSSNVWAATGPLANEQKVSQIAAAAVDKYLYPAQPYLFRWFLSGRAAATAQMAYVERQMRAKNMTHPRIAVIRYDSTGTAAWFEAVSDALKEKGWTPVEVQVFPATATDVTPAASAVAASRPDFVLSALTDTQAPLVVAGIRQRGSQAPIVNYVGSAESMLQRVRDPNLLVIREWTVPTDPTVPALKEMLKDAQEAGVDKDITVNLTATAGYVMGMVLEAAAKRCGWPCDPVKYRDALESIDSLDTKGLSGGPVGVSKDDHLYPNYATLYRWDDQKGHSVPEGDPIAVQ